MMHTIFQDHRTFASGGEDVRGFTIFGRSGNLGQVTWTIYVNIHSPFQLRLPGVLSSIPGFSSLSDETLNRGPVSV